MSKAKIPGPMPAARNFGWQLKDSDSSHFEIVTRDNGQFAVVLNHALLRGVRADMIAWWFQNFTRLSVTLEDVPGYEGQSVPAYLLWHPSDHFNATLLGEVQANGAPIAGKTRILIQEAMQYDTYGWDYPVNTTMDVTYCADDGWAMGRSLPIFGPAMMLRIHFRDVIADTTHAHVGVQYHYEIVIGVSGKDPVSRLINSRLTASFGPQFFEAWQGHNVIEVGTFENFLPALYAQRSDGLEMTYRQNMSVQFLDQDQTGYDEALFKRRVSAFKSARDPLEVLGYDKASIL